MVEAAAAQRLHQRLGDVLLPDDLGKRPRPVLAVERQRHLSPSFARRMRHGPRATVPPGSDILERASTGAARA
jgi:hypothetical protein